MKFKALIFVPLLFALTTAVLAGEDERRNSSTQQVERTVTADPGVMVSLCVMSGSINVSGWDRNEVFARSDAHKIDFKGETTGDAPAPKRLELSIIEPHGARVRPSCQGYSDVELKVPQGATVQIQTRDGSISISGVTAAYAGTQNGDITIQQVVKWVEAATIGGSIIARDLGGRITLTSIGGGIDATNVRPVNSGDAFDAASVSGDINLVQVGHSRFNVKSVSGNVNLRSPLVRGGRYGFLTMSGDVTLSLPEDASFELNAKVSNKDVVVSDFPLQVLAEGGSTSVGSAMAPGAPAPPRTPSTRVAPRVKPGVVVKVDPRATVIILRRVNAVHGTGEANISVASFSGKVLLKKN
ncbi:MAG TPA: DUF4097 family beta strand repeat-containing protein [Pyrinomonadaceae bacterium]|nr:DUF4097 family beta strand repeat-containing protein [Pyrinomonadaceae bacterium]